MGDAKISAGERCLWDGGGEEDADQERYASFSYFHFCVHQPVFIEFHARGGFARVNIQFSVFLSKEKVITC